MHQNNDSNPVVLLASYSSPSEAFVVKDMLEANGIVCTANDSIMSSFYGGVAFPVRLFVLRSQLEAARQLLAEHDDL